MSFIDWMNMSMFIDISFVVFTCAFVWKLRKLNKTIQKLSQEKETMRKVMVEMHQNFETLCEDQARIEEDQARMEECQIKIEKDLALVMKNPAAARRALKQREQ